MNIRIAFQIDNEVETSRIYEITIDNNDISWEAIVTKIASIDSNRKSMVNSTDMYLVLIDETSRKPSSPIIDNYSRFVKFLDKYNSSPNLLFEICSRSVNLPTKSAVNKASESIKLANSQVLADQPPPPPSAIPVVNRVDHGSIPVNNIHTICRNGDLEMLKVLISTNKVNMNAKDESDRTPLHIAAQHGHLHIVEYLVQHNVFKNNRDNCGRTPLLCAILGGHVEVTQYLVKEKCFTFVVDSEGNGPLHLAFLSKSEPLKQYLLQSGLIDLSIKNNQGKLYGEMVETPAVVPVASDSQKETSPSKIKTISFLFSDVDNNNNNSWSVDINIASIESWDNLCFELIRNSPESAKDIDIQSFVLLDQDNERCSNEIFDMKKLKKIMEKCYLSDDMKILVNYSIKQPPAPEPEPVLVEAVENVGVNEEKSGVEEPPSSDMELLRACEIGDSARVKSLLDSAASLNARNNDKQSGLHLVSIHGHESIAKLLIAKNIFKNTRDAHGFTPIQYAVIYNHLEIVQLLIQSNAFSFVLDGSGNTLLHLAAKNSNRKLLEWLIKNADIDQQLINSDGKKFDEFNNVEVKQVIEVSEIEFADESDGDDVDAEADIDSIANSSDHQVSPNLIESSSQSDVSPPRSNNKVSSTVITTEAFLECCAEQNFAGAAELMDHSDVNAVHESGLTVLHIGVDCDEFDFVAKLLKCGANVNVIDSHGSTPLHYACLNQNYAIAKLLLENKAHIVADEDGMTPLHHSCIHENYEITRLLISKGAKVDQIDNFGNNCLHYACKSQNDQLALWLTTQSETALFALNLDGESPYDLIRNAGNVELSSQLLLTHQSMQESKLFALNTKKALDLASRGDFGFLEESKGNSSNQTFDMSSSDSHGKCLIHYAAQFGDLNAVEKLLSNSNNLNVLDKKGGVSPLHIATRNGHENICKLLLEMGAAVDLAGSHGRTALYYAFEANHLNIAKLLHLYGANCDQVFRVHHHNTTLLHLACERNDLEWVRWLISSCQVKVNVKNDAMLEPFDLALKNMNLDIIAIFQDLFRAEVTKNFDKLKWLLSFDEFEKALDYLTKTQFLPRVLDCLNKFLIYSSKIERIPVSFIRQCIEFGANVKYADEEGVTCTHQVASTGNLPLLTWIIKQGAPLDDRAANGMTPLHFACMSGNEPTIRWLIERGGNVYARCNAGASVLHFSCYSGNSKMVNQFIRDFGFTVLDDATSSGLKPVDFACKSGNIEFVLWLSHELQLSATEALKLKSLTLREKQTKDLAVVGRKAKLACKLGDLETLNNILQTAGFDINHPLGGESLYTLLHTAVELKNIEIIKMLLDSHADVDKPDANGLTPLLLACKLGNSTIIDLLLSHGADISKLDKFGNSALYWACCSNSTELVLKLVDTHLCLNELSMNCDGITPLAAAAKHRNDQIVIAFIQNPRMKRLETVLFRGVTQGSSEIVQDALRHGAFVDSTNLEKQTPLHIACLNNNLNIVEILVEAKAELNSVNNHFVTPLHIAAQNGCIEIIKCLLDRCVAIGHGDDYINCIDYEGLTPFLYACKHGQLLTAAYLLEHGAEVTAIDDQGSSALHYAAQSGDLSMVQWLYEGYGLNPECVNNASLSAADVASQHGFDEIFDYLSDIMEALAYTREVEEAKQAEETRLMVINDQESAKYQDAIRIEERARRQAEEWEAQRALEIKLQQQAKSKAVLAMTCSKHLIHAVEETDVDSVIELLENGGDPNVQRESDGITPLIAAAAIDELQILKILLNAGSDINAVDFSGNSAFLVACLNSSNQCIRELGSYPTLRILSNKSGVSPREAIVRTENVTIILQIYQTPLRSFSLYDFDETGFNMLHIALSVGKEALVLKLLELGFDANVPTTYQKYPIHLASEIGSVVLLKHLFASGADLHVKSLDQKTSLMYAVLVGGYEATSFLLKEGVSVYEIDNSGNTALHYACGKGNYKLAKLLMDYGSNIYLKNAFSQSMLDLCKSSHNTEIEKLIKQKINSIKEIIEVCASNDVAWLQNLISSGAQLEVGNEEGITPLLASCLHGAAEVFLIISKLGLSYEIEDNYGRNAWICACTGGNLRILKHLFTTGVNVTHKSLEGKSGLEYLCQYGHFECLKWLHEDAKIDLKTIQCADESSLLHVAAHYNHVTIVKLLCEAGLALDSHNSHGLNAFHVACVQSSSDVISFLAQWNSSLLTKKDRHGLPPFLLTCQYASLEMVQLLYALGANIFEVSSSIGENSLHYACRSGKLDIVFWLIEHGVNPQAKNVHGLTPLDLVTSTHLVKSIQTMCSRYPDRAVDSLVPLIMQFATKRSHEALVHAAFWEIITCINSQATKLLLLDVFVMAAGYGNLEIVKYLLKFELSGAEISPFLEVTAVDFASSNNQIMVLNLLKDFVHPPGSLAHDQPTDPPQDLDSFLDEFDSACYQGKLDIVTSYSTEDLLSRKIQENVMNGLHYACIGGHLQVALFLINQGHFDVNQPESLSGNTPLHLVCYNHHEDMIMHLIRLKANPSILNYKSQSPLHILCEQNRVDLIQQLISLPRSILKDLDLNVLNRDKQNLLHIAVKNNCLDMVNLLVSQYIDLNCLDSQLRTPLHYACCEGKLEIAFSLLKAAGGGVGGAGGKVSPQLLDTYGFNCLHLLIIFAESEDVKSTQFTELIELMLTSSSVEDGLINMPTSHGDTPLHLACCMQNNPSTLLLVQCLLKHGASLEIVNGEGLSPLKIAHGKGNDEVVQWMLAWKLSQKLNKHVDEIFLAASSGTSNHLSESDSEDLVDDSLEYESTETSTPPLESPSQQQIKPQHQQQSAEYFVYDKNGNGGMGEYRGQSKLIV